MPLRVDGDMRNKTVMTFPPGHFYCDRYGARLARPQAARMKNNPRNPPPKGTLRGEPPNVLQVKASSGAS